MLSQEKPNFSAEELATAYRESLTAARRLAHTLVKFERNENPMDERNAPNPNVGIKIRVLKPAIHARVDVTKECRDHNTMVQNLGRP